MHIERASGNIDALAAGVLAEKARASFMMETLYQLEARDPAGNLLWTETAKNRVVTAGLNKLLDATFKTGLASPLWYIGICGPSVSDAVTTNSSTTLTSATAGFAGGDAGRNIIVRGAGAAGADLVTTIASVTNSTTIVLGAAASASLTNVRIIFEARAADTMSSHSPWAESAAYSSPGTRPAFTPGTISGGSVDNSGSPASYTINGDNTLIGGLFLTDNNTISGTSGTLYGMAPFTVSFRQLNTGDTLTVTATLTAAST
jgi:hypothetical protein